MPIINLENPSFISIDGAGRPNAGGTVEVYTADGLFTTLATIYSDKIKTTELTNPVTLDDAGVKEIWFDVKVDTRERTKAGVLIRDTESIDPDATDSVVQSFNLASNGSFEIDFDADGQPDSWTIEPYAGSAIAITSSIVTDGANALEFNTAAAGTGGGKATGAKFPVTEGSVCSVSFSFFATNDTTINTFEINWYDEDDILKSTSTITMPASGDVPTSWTQYQQEVIVDEDGTQGEIVITGISSGGANLNSKAYFDGVTLLSKTAIIPYIVKDKSEAVLLDPVSNNIIYILSDDGKGNIWRLLTGAIGLYSDDSVSSCGTVFIPTGGDGSAGWVRDFENEIRVEWYGSVGDDSDENVELTEAFAAGAGKKIIFEPNKTYRTSEELELTDDSSLDLNGSTLNFSVSGAKKCLVINSNSVVENGKIDNVVGNNTIQDVISVGRFTDQLTRHNVIIRNLTIDSSTTGGNGIDILGDSSNVIVDNINFPSNAELATAVQVHYGTDGAAPPVTTYHSHNIKISNIKCEDFTYSASAAAIIWISAGYNVDVSNISVHACPDMPIVFIYAGDYGFQFASLSGIRTTGSSGIKISGIYGKAFKAVAVSMKNILGAPLKLWQSAVDISAVSVFGYGATDSLSNGIDLNACDNITLRDSELREFYANVFIGDDVLNVTIEKSNFESAYALGIDVRSSGGEGITISSNNFEGNNQGGVATGSDIRIQDADGVLIENNVMSSALAKQNVLLDVAPNSPSNVRVVGNHSRNVIGTNTCFQMGANDDVLVCTEFRNNISDTSPTFGIRHGQYPIALDRIPNRSGNDLVVIGSSSRIPTAGAWIAGSILYNDAAAVADANNMVLDHWRCTVSGTPGTWVAQYLSTVSPAT